MTNSTPLYQQFAQSICAYKNCVASKDGNAQHRNEWEERHLNRIDTLVRERMPHGSGFDSGTMLDMERCNDERLVFITSFHHMNEGGFYDGWSEHEVIVKPNLALEFTLRVTGKDRNDIKEYIGEMFSDCLYGKVTVDQVKTIDARNE